MNPLLAGLIRIARAIGRWILDVAARRGGRWLAEYIDERVLVFRKRLARARTEHRAAWLRGRISRWQAAAKWLRANAATVDDKVVELARKLPEVAKLPKVAAGEVEPRAA